MMNFRSSTGFGKAFTNAGDNQWGERIIGDQYEAVQWAIQHGIADPQKVAVMGGSFGGYSTLAGLTFYPETYACGVDLFGPSNLVTLLESMPPYWKPMLEMFTTRVGDHRTEEGRGFARPENNLSFSAVAEAFLAKCLGGAYQPIGEDFKGSSVRVLTGAGDVLGLAEALAGAR